MNFSLFCSDFLGSQARPAPRAHEPERLRACAHAGPSDGGRREPPDDPAHGQRPRPERLRARPCGCPAMLLVARKDR